MTFAVNPVDGCRVYFEDDGGEARPLLILNGLGDPIAASRKWGVARTLAADHRLVFVDQRGHGMSDKPHDPAAYSTSVRVADVVAVLDELGIERAHVLGISWGARLAFGIGEHAADRVLSLIMGGQSPYAMRRDSPGVRMITDAFGRGGSMSDFVEALGGFGDLDDETRALTLDNDFHALAAAWRMAMEEGDVARNLADWQLPCLIYAGTQDLDFFEDAKRAASEIPGAQFVALEGMTHLQAHENTDAVLPHIQRVLYG